LGTCRHDPLDGDDDGYAAEQAYDGTVCGGDDCDDTRSDVYPGAPEICADGVDQDCDGSIDGLGLVLSTDVQISSNEYAGRPSLAWSGSEFAVALHDSRSGCEEVYFSRVSAAGAKIGADVKMDDCSYLGYGDEFPSLSWNGSGYGMVWVHDWDDDIIFQGLSSTGGKIGTSVMITDTTSHEGNPDIVWSGSEFGLAYSSWIAVCFARITAAGGIVSGGAFCHSDDNSRYRPSLVWTGWLYSLIWEDQRNGTSNEELYFFRIDADGTRLGSDIRITNDSNHSRAPSLVWTGSVFGVAWEDDRAGNYEIYFAQFDIDGVKLTSDVRLSNAGGDSRVPALMWSGSEYVTCWSDLRSTGWGELYCTTVSPSGAWVAFEQRVSPDPGGEPDLVWTGSEIGIAWHKSRSGIYFNKLGRCD